MEETIINFGSEIKALSTSEDGTVKIGGYLVLFGSPSEHDATPQRDYFTKATDFDIEDGDKTTVYYHHGLDPTLKARKLSSGTLSVKDAGVWFESQIKARDAYEEKIMEMVKAGKLGLSSGTASHLVERERVGQANHIKRWPLGLDASLTPTPGEPRTVCMSLKALTDEAEAHPVDLMGAEIKADEAPADEVPPPATTVTDIRYLNSNGEYVTPETKTHNFTSPDEVVTAITDILRAKMPLDWHLESARAAVKSSLERIQGTIDARCVKSGRVLSSDTHSRLSDHHAALTAVCEDMGQLLKEHGPQEQADTKTISEADVQQAMARYAATMALLNGVPV